MPRDTQEKRCQGGTWTATSPLCASPGTTGAGSSSPCHRAPASTCRRGRAPSPSRSCPFASAAPATHGPVSPAVTVTVQGCHRSLGDNVAGGHCFGREGGGVGVSEGQGWVLPPQHRVHSLGIPILCGQDEAKKGAWVVEGPRGVRCPRHPLPGDGDGARGGTHGDRGDTGTGGERSSSHPSTHRRLVPTHRAWNERVGDRGDTGTSARTPVV